MGYTGTKEGRTIDYVKRISNVQIEKRRGAILEILREEGLPFTLRRIRENAHWVENIVIPFRPTDRRLVIGAHYDNLEGSTGANDNSSGVSVLIRLARRLSDADAENIEIVLFDREEYGDHGSAAYIKETGRANISMMINLDTCGFGDAISVITKGNVGNPLLRSLLTPDMIKDRLILSIDRLPTRFGDDDTFDEYGIPNIAITTMPRQEALRYRSFIEKAIRGIECTQDEIAAVQNLDYTKTMHNRELDCITSVSEATLDMVLSYLTEGLLGPVGA